MKKVTLKNYKNLLGDKKSINWKYSCHYQKLSKNFIRKFQKEVNWIYISMYQKLSENFIREFKDEVNWTSISRYQRLSEKFIREFKNEVDWYKISQHQRLSKKFIRKFKDKVDWDNISQYQQLSDDFIREFKDNIKEHKLLKSVHYCGAHNRCIYINKDDPNIIHLGCFSGNKEEAIKAVSIEYKDKDKKKYISQIEECFNY